MEDLTNWPKESGEYKIVQMEIDHQICIRFPENWAKNHSDILFETVELLGTKCPEQMNATGDQSIPTLESDRYKVCGMGKATVDIDKKEALFYGRSWGYPVLLNSEHLERIKSLYPEWSIKKE